MGSPHRDPRCRIPLPTHEASPGMLNIPSPSAELQHPSHSLSQRFTWICQDIPTFGFQLFRNTGCPKL